MHNKVYEKLKKISKFINENKKILIIDIIILALFLIPTGYDIYSPGSLLNLEDKITVEDSYSKNGSINATYVTSRNASIALLVASKFIPSWDAVKKEDLTIENESYESMLIREKQMLKTSVNEAIIVAYSSSDKDVVIKNKSVKIIANLNKNNLKVGDTILKVDKKEVKSLKDIEKELKGKKKVTLQIKRDKKIINVKTKLTKEGKLGIYVSEEYSLKTDPKIKIKNEKNESGSSAGLMNSLYIYNELNNVDITKGLKISGTGTIDRNGNVGEISGVKYKLIGAVKKHADVFICPYENYSEALKVKKKHNYTIKIIKAKTFDEALKKLENI